MNCIKMVRLRKWYEDWKDIIVNDPIRKCTLYKKEGCNCVDSQFCDIKTCEWKAKFDEKYLRHNKLKTILNGNRR